MDVQILAKEFKEKHWINYYQMSKRYFESLPESTKKNLDTLDIQEDIKTVLIYRLKDNAKTWLHSDLPLLDGIKPLELLESEEGIKALKEILLRMPD